MTNTFTLDIAFEKQLNAVSASNAVDLSLDVIRNFLMKSKSNVVFVLDHNETYSFSMLMSGMDAAEHDRIEYYNLAHHLAAVDIMKALSEGCEDHDGDVLVVWAGLVDIHPMDLIPSVKFAAKLCHGKFSVLIPATPQSVPKSVINNTTNYTTGETHGTTKPNGKDDENDAEAGSEQHN